MASVLRSFLIAIGVDTTEVEKGEKRVTGSLSSISSEARIAGAALSAMGKFTLGALVGIGYTVDKVNKDFQELSTTASTLNTGTSQIMKMQGALRNLGLDSDGALSSLQSMEGVLTSIVTDGGAAAALSEKLGKAGLGPQQVGAIIGSKSGAEMTQVLAGIMPKLAPRQKAMVGDALGLDQNTIVALSKGSEELNRALELAGNQMQLTALNADDIASYNVEIGKLSNQLDGLANVTSGKVTPAMTNLISKLNGVVETVTPAYETTLGSTLDVVGSIWDAFTVTPVETAKSIWDSVSSPDGSPSSSSTRGDYSPADMYNYYKQEYTPGAGMMGVPTIKVDTGGIEKAISDGMKRSKVEVNVSLDGNAFDSRVRQVSEQDHFDTLQEFYNPELR